MYDKNATPLIHAVGLGATISWIEEAGPPHTGNVANSEVSLFKSPWAIHRHGLQILWAAFSEWGKNVKLHDVICSLKFQLKNVIITRVSWHLGKRKKENKCEIHNWPIGCTGSFQHIFVSLFYLCAVLSPSTDSVKGASFNTQYAMSISLFSCWFQPWLISQPTVFFSYNKPAPAGLISPETNQRTGW